MIIDDEAYLMHYGILRRSGRYPWGSGGPEKASNKGFLDYVDQLKREGLTEAQIARGMGISTTELRAAKSIAKAEQKQSDIDMAVRLKEKGLSNTAIGERMGKNESTVRTLLADDAADKAKVLNNVSETIKNAVDEKGYIDVGTGVDRQLGISSTKLNQSVAILREEGYTLHYVKVEQLGTGKFTTVKVLAKPDVSYSEVMKNRDKITQIQDFSDDGGRTILGIQPPLSISSKRLKVRYADEGGTDADGVVYVRPGVKDLSLGGAHYAQVRIAVDGTHFIKGMAMYKDDLPPGVDLVFNTNKHDTGRKLDALKAMKDDPDNPFGATVRQLVDSKGKVRSAMNIVNEEGSWDGWAKSLSSQMLSKQSPVLAKDQLDIAYTRKKAAYDEIMSLTNPAVRKRLLESYADDVDASAVHLKAAALPRQASHVILPVNSMKETEIYAPNYRNGERVALVRYPHGGTFEIPELTVNNRHPEAKKLLGNARDAVGIHSKVAERLSGADFDGDTVLVIPNNHGKVKTSPPLEGLRNFDPKAAYPAYPGMRRMSARTKGVEMGNVSNLITDMTIKGASQDELARAVRHSMVVIDAEKHNLNWKESARVNGIAQLKEKYQGGSRRGASTLISRATSDIRVNERKGRPAAEGGPIDRVTGKKMYVDTGATYTNKQGKKVYRTEKSVKLAETDDAHTLSSGTHMEKIYADHSNKLKSLANQARREALHSPPLAYSPSARSAYASEVASLNSKLNVALKNRPLERQAQVFANATVSAKKRDNPDMDSVTLKKVKAQALAAARARTGAQKQQIVITDKEWEAIQAGAIRNNKLLEIMSNSDLDRVMELATPKTRASVSPAVINRAKAMLNNGYTQADVADALGISVSTLKTGLDGG